MGFAASLIPAVGSLVGGFLNKKSKDKEASALQQTGAEANAQIQPFADSGVAANDVITNVLSGGRGADDAFKKFQNSTGFRAMIDEGVGAITGSQAAKGLLNSGSTLKKLNQFGRDRAEQSFGNFLNLAGSQANRGANAAARVATNINDTGQRTATARSQGDEALQEGVGGAANTVFNALSSKFGG